MAGRMLVSPIFQLPEYFVAQSAVKGHCLRIGGVEPDTVAAGITRFFLGLPHQSTADPIVAAFVVYPKHLDQHPAIGGHSCEPANEPVFRVSCGQHQA